MSLSQCDYKVYDELRQMKREVVQENSLLSLQGMMDKMEGKEVEPELA